MVNKTNVMKQYDNEKNRYQNFGNAVEYLLKTLLFNADIEYNAITYRVKERESLSRKIDSKGNKYRDLSELTDIVGIRIITYYADDVDKIANIVEREFDVDKENSIDKRKSLEPDRFGYCSVHYVVGIHSKRLALREYLAYKGLKCEIQIRSILQHAWAEIEHDLGYKSAITVPREIRRDFSRLAGLLELADKEFDEIRKKLFSYKIEVESKITDENFKNQEIDAILLNTLINSNEDIKEINNTIERYAGVDFTEELTSEGYTSTIQELNSLNIKTLGDLNEVITDTKELAIKIAHNMLCKDDDEEGVSVIRRTIAFFYLCYARLFVQSDDKRDYIKYLSDNNIGNPETSKEEIAESLLLLRKELVG